MTPRVSPTISILEDKGSPAVAEEASSLSRFFSSFFIGTSDFGSTQVSLSTGLNALMTLGSKDID